MSYSYDRLGRMTHVSSNTIERQFYWDTDRNQEAVAFGRGNLVDVVGFEKNTDATVAVHFDYDAGSRPTKKTWQLPVQGIGRSYSLQFSYDPQGRIGTLTYPTLPGEWVPLSLKYNYDEFSGGVKTITDNVTGSVLWSGIVHNALGQVTEEVLQLPGTAAATLASNYDLFDGRRRSSTLAGSNGQIQVSYAYQADGLPASVGMSGSGGTWSATMDYDNLARLTAWGPITYAVRRRRQPRTTFGPARNSGVYGLADGSDGEGDSLVPS